MPFLQVLADILLPVFVIVGIGAVAARRLSLDAQTLSKLAYWIVGPAFVFDILAGADLGAALVGKVAGVTLVAMAATGVVAAVAARVSGAPAATAAATVLTSIYGNVGNFGLAIVAFTFGTDALALAGVVLVVVNVVGIIVGVAAARWEHHGAASAVRRALTAPMTLAAIPALVVNAGGWTLPLWADRAVGLLATALIPLMLLTLGVQLAAMRSPKPTVDTIRALVVKLAVAPAVATVAAVAAGLEGTDAGVVVLQFAMPPAVFTALIALEHDLAPDLVATTVLVGTVASVVTLPLVILWLG